MALSSLDREIRATRQHAPRVSDPSHYKTYLQSPHWRKRRNDALRAAAYTCQRCGARSGLQVHHLTYENIGAELDADLQVLCRTCHEGEHVAQDQREHAGIYVRVVSAAIEEARFTSMADLLDAVKTTCARLRIRYRPEQISEAVTALDARRKGILDAPQRTAPTPPREMRPVTQSEAVAIMRRLNVKVGLREMPTTAPMTDDAINAFKAAYVWER